MTVGVPPGNKETEPDYSEINEIKSKEMSLIVLLGEFGDGLRITKFGLSIRKFGVPRRSKYIRYICN